MIAGLLGEHLASPRTATKTNQSTAFEPKPADTGEAGAQEGFASFVAKDSSKPDAPRETSERPPQAEASPETAETDLTKVQPLTAEILPPETPRPDIGLADTAVPAVDAEVADTALPAGRAEPVVINGVLTDRSVLTPEAAAETSEIAAEDPRLRQTATPSADAAETPADTIKLSERGEVLPTDASDDALRRASQPQAGEAPLTLDRTSDSIEGDTNRTPTRADLVEAPALEAQTRAQVTDVEGLERTALTTLNRDGSPQTAEPLITIGATSGSGSTQAGPQLNAGLTPTAPATVVAAPGDLSSIILNAVKNGMDPQEQLIVQLDPPELGRVMIDFKFDAQGLQQIVITSENPEALKRLREMHFELTEALRENGLSDKNMSFRQETEERSQQAWQGAERGGSSHSIFGSDEPLVAAAASPSTPPKSQAQDRLDLLL